MYVGLLHVKSHIREQMSSRRCGEEVWRERCQVQSSSSDHGSKLRGLSQNNPHVASKRDINITKLQLSHPACSDVVRGDAQGASLGGSANAVILNNSKD
ncbi:hypothetical protein AVEN_213327-1 [Araneus ventricosus]|uniref:Uncharacterized protein n=1 Tax=Araneus ventricosus TaxID=182803 RepID=A0A4Y2IBW0_ARAVE|nr:hypothetical protein AVEN_213327-1 [Araneus ventricosus]